jgi:hypothetical protein
MMPAQQFMNELYPGKVPGNFPTISIIGSFMNDYRTLERSDA